MLRRSRSSAGALRGGAVFATRRVRAGGALRGVATGALRVDRFGVVPFLAVAADLDAVLGFARLVAAGLVRLVTTRPAFRAGAFVLPAGAARRRTPLAARGVLRRADAADVDAVFFPLARLPARELVRAAFLVPPAALRLAIACSFSGPHRGRRLP